MLTTKITTTIASVINSFNEVSTKVDHSIIGTITSKIMSIKEFLAQDFIPYSGISNLVVILIAAGCITIKLLDVNKDKESNLGKSIAKFVDKYPVKSKIFVAIGTASLISAILFL